MLTPRSPLQTRSCPGRLTVPKDIGPPRVESISLRAADG